MWAIVKIIDFILVIICYKYAFLATAKITSTYDKYHASKYPVCSLL